ncbi:zinc finger BED domain-containing protein DAYSLEEPER-like [Astyanax mexicanus]|uniref:Zinc finger BED domain-containing protein DAYSLEEPER-like n=1 Tax=Astyanax mexicanus TaxID=7994 RepID=A0A8T2L9N0_ASTMX|nr:zinc finger BED domain-containing protein DAYSLEEPER-like [Astyanax mexicanus]
MITTKRTVYIEKTRATQSQSMDLRQKLGQKRDGLAKRKRSPETAHDMDLRKKLGKRSRLFEEEPTRQPATSKDLKPSPWLNMIITDLHPPTFVEEKGFLNLLRSLGLGSETPPNSADLHSELVQLYDQTKESVKRALQTAETVSLACDFWNSGAGQYLMTVTSHFISEQWKRESFVLETTLIPEHWTSYDTINQLKKIAHTWGIEKKVQVVVTNANNLEIVANDVGWEHLSCFAKTLNSVFRQVAKSDNVKKVLEKCSKVDMLFCHNMEEMKKLRETQIELDLPQHSLTSANEVSWLSTLIMLERISEQQEALDKFLLDMNKFKLLLKKDDKRVMRSLIKALQPFREVTEGMMKDQHCSISNIIPCVEELKMKLKEQTENRVAQSLVKHLSSDQFKPTTHLTMSTALDPRYKHIVLSEAGTTEEFETWLVSELNLKSEAFLLSQKKKLEEYIKAKPLPKMGNPLSFWRFNYKKLNSVAHKHLNIVATALPLDRAFNVQKSQLMSRRRSFLQPELLNMMLFLNGNCSTE